MSEREIECGRSRSASTGAHMILRTYGHFTLLWRDGADKNGPMSGVLDNYFTLLRPRFAFRCVFPSAAATSTISVFILCSTMDRTFREQYINLYGTDSALIFQAMKYFRQILSRTIVPDASNLSLEPMVKGSMVPRFVELLNRYDHPNVQMEAAWALTNLACGTATETWMLVALGAAQKLVELITRSTNAHVRDQAVWAISNVAGDSHECREYLLKIGALEACLSECNRFRHRRYVATSKSQESRCNLIWALSNQCRSRSSSAHPWHKFAPVVGVIAQLFAVPVNLADDELVAEACWTLAYLMDGNVNWSPVQAVLEAGLVVPLVNLLSADHRNPNRVLAAVVRALGNVVTGTAEQTQTVLDAGALPRLHCLLKRENDTLVREVCWLLSNITAGTEQQVGSVLECPDLFARLVLLAGGHRSCQVRREAAWAICNALSGGDAEQKRRVISSGCVGSLVLSLSSCDDARLLEALLTSIEIIASIGREQQTTSNFGNNSFALMVVELGGVEQLKRLAEESRWAFGLRVRCLQLVNEFFTERLEEKRSECFDDGPIVIRFNRIRG